MKLPGLAEWLEGQVLERRRGLRRGFDPLPLVTNVANIETLARACRLVISMRTMLDHGALTGPEATRWLVEADALVCEEETF